MSGSRHACLLYASFNSFYFSSSNFQVLLLFARTDSQTDAMIRAAEAGHYEMDVAKSPESALQLYLAKHHSVVFVDTRHGATVDPEGFARYSELDRLDYISAPSTANPWTCTRSSARYIVIYKT